jgi:hypothetical protein
MVGLSQPAQFKAMAPRTESVQAENSKNGPKIIEVAATGIAVKSRLQEYLADEAPALTDVRFSALGTAWVSSSEKHLAFKVKL